MIKANRGKNIESKHKLYSKVRQTVEVGDIISFGVGFEIETGVVVFAVVVFVAVVVVGVVCCVVACVVVCVVCASIPKLQPKSPMLESFNTLAWHREEREQSTDKVGLR